jgi:hypothetical protein
VVAGCSRDPERSVATSPTTTAAPEPGSLIGPTSVAPGGVSGKHDVSFPGRDQSFDFRNRLETKYQSGLGRTMAPTFVDREGEVVWTQEYTRYRVNGCDHTTATQRVLAQIAGQAAGSVCGAPPDGLIIFPPRNESFDFRRQLETRYQQFGRGASQSAVDAEGGVIWTQEYLRYRVNQCDHSTAVEKVFSQIDGGGVAATCYVPPCVFTVSPTAQAVPAAGGTFSAVVTNRSGANCSFTADTPESFVRIVRGASGSGTTTSVTYTVSSNSGSARTGIIRVRYANASVTLEITQASGTLSSTCTILAWACSGSGTYGAISCHISRTGRYCGWAAGYTSQYFAQETARVRCAGNNALSSCFDAVWFRSQCGAVAAAPALNWGWALGASREIAERDALAVCNR